MIQTHRKKAGFQHAGLLLMLLPGVVFVFIFSYIPLYGILLAFKNYNYSMGIWGSPWAGLEHFRTFLTNPDFFRLMRNTLLLNIYSLLFYFPMPIVLAILLYEVRGRFFKRFVQTVSYVPHFLSTVAIVTLMGVLLSPESGIVNLILKSTGAEPIYFMAKPEWFRTLYIGSTIWQNAGFSAIIYLAALSSIDTEQYDAAYIDGASRLQRIRYISLPGIGPTIIIMLLLRLGDLLELGFEKAFLMQNPLTYDTSDVVSTYVYRVGLMGGEFSYATAVGIFNMVLSLILIGIFNQISRKASSVSLW
ncbi:ABC transporter permease [Paenibacillus koleovorans]|uniref:ABC transporter permease n=1 Tax=Paenibacillus koleovorans TaxID=121608 RepID=UPI000FDC896D|nr:ABC transporter permease subunit [Paenibacillus koleovorans]